jgi:uncharacterized protein YxjI
MGLLGRDRGGPAMRRFQMREKALAIGDDFWVEDDQGQRAFKVDGKALRIRSTFTLEDASGTEVASIKERMMTIRDTMVIELPGGHKATVKKRLIGFRDRFNIEVEGGPKLTATGNFVDHEYEIEQDGHKVGVISKKWFRIRDTYGIEVAEGADPAFMIAISVCIDEMAHDIGT